METKMDAILEVNPSMTDTSMDQDSLLKELQKMSKEMAQPGDFVVEVPDDSSEEVLEESDSTFNIDGKNKDFKYISSVNKDNKMYSFGQDGLGLWWWFERISLYSGKNLQGPFTTKDKLIKSMGERYA